VERERRLWLEILQRAGSLCIVLTFGVGNTGAGHGLYWGGAYPAIKRGSNDAKQWQ